MYDQAYCYKITEQLKNLDKRLTRIQRAECKHPDIARRLYENLERMLTKENKEVSENINKINPETLRWYVITVGNIEHEMIKAFQRIKKEKEEYWAQIH